MAKKDIRVTFFYADTGVWKQAKKSKIRQTLVQWADGFYDGHNYGFRIDQFPIVPYSEKVYQKKFCLFKTSGPKARIVDVVALSDEIDEMKKTIKARSAISDQLKALGPREDLDAAGQSAWDDLHKKRDELGAEWDRLSLIYDAELEMQIRRLLHPIIGSLSSPKERLPVIFCEFSAAFSSDQRSAHGVTYRSRRTWYPSAVLTMYTGAFVLINKDSKSRFVLAHEICHAAGCEHQDTPPNNLMRVGRETDRSFNDPANVMMTPDDLTRLGVAIFVA